MDKSTEQNKEIEIILDNPILRAELARNSHEFFFSFYFPHYIKYPSAPFHKDIFTLTEDDKIKSAVIIAFRGSAKSTIMTLSYPLWSIMGNQQKKFIIIIGRTQQQARLHFINIKQELESNQLLKNDLGPFQESDAIWNAFTLEIPKYGACITTVSLEQPIRGMRYKEHRPDLIICDDIEDLSSVKTKEGRDKVFRLITGEVIPAGEKNTKTIFIGNLLHEDNLLMRLKDLIDKNEYDGVFKYIPIIDENNKITWPGKYPSMNEINVEKKKTGSELAFQREYMLTIIADEDRIIQRPWIQYYDSLPKENPQFICVGVDLAISQKSTADFTAIVTAYVYGSRENTKIYILPNPINNRLNFRDTIERIKLLHDNYNAFCIARFYIEDVGYQASAIEQLINEGYHVEPFKVQGQDKSTRLAIISNSVQDGKVLFPKEGAKDLIQQLVNFGIEKHDDLADAFAMAVNKSIMLSSKIKLRGYIHTDLRL